MNGIRNTDHHEYCMWESVAKRIGALDNWVIEDSKRPHSARILDSGFCFHRNAVLRKTTLGSIQLAVQGSRFPYVIFHNKGEVVWKPNNGYTSISLSFNTMTRLHSLRCYNSWASYLNLASVQGMHADATILRTHLPSHAHLEIWGP